MLKNILEEIKLSDIETKHVFPEGTFSKDKTPDEIAKIVCKYSKDYNQASKRVTFHYNRSGKNEIDRHKEILKKLKNICEN